MSRDILDYVADEIRGNRARVPLQLDESTGVSNCTIRWFKRRVLDVRKYREN